MGNQHVLISRSVECVAFLPKAKRLVKDITLRTPPKHLPRDRVVVGGKVWGRHLSVSPPMVLSFTPKQLQNPENRWCLKDIH